MPSSLRPLARRHVSPRRSLGIESLERRQVLAGDVAAQLVGSTLLLTGDALGNGMVVASAAGGRIAVLGSDTTINGSTDPFVTSKPVVNIVASLAGGDDGISFGNSAQGLADQFDWLGITPPFDVKDLQDAIDAVADGATVFVLPGNLTVTTAAGTDLVSIIGSVGGSVAANLGPAPTGPESGNALLIGGFEAAYASRVGGSLSVVGGAQRDFVELAGTTVAGAVAANLGGGENSLSLFESSVGSLTYAGGAGRDFVDAADLGVRYDASIATAGGDDEVYLHEHGGPQTRVGGGMVIDTGSGADYVEISSAVRGALTVATGGGGDGVDVYETSVGLNAVIDTGAGEDGVTIDLVQIRYNLVVSLGAGDDELEIADTTALAAFLYGGPGFNTLTIDPASRAGIRRLFTSRLITT